MMETVYASTVPITACLDKNGELAMRVRRYLTAQRPEFSSLSVGARDGNVDLSGELPTYYLRQLAVAAAQRVAGVLQVVDRLDVDDRHSRPMFPD
jgi:osmotically-inducible protein OsmY